MRVLVCVKQVPDVAQVRLSADFTLRRDGVAQRMNPADESALEFGLRLKNTHGATVTVLTMGLPSAEAMLRDALSRGANRAVHLTDSAFAGSDTLATARNLALAVKHLEGFDLLLCGRRAIDGETGQVGPMLAAMLGLPCLPNVLEARMEQGAMIARQLTERGILSWRVSLPVLITLCEGSYRLRLPSLMGLRTAQASAIVRLNAKDIGAPANGLTASPTRVCAISACPAEQRSCQKMPPQGVLEALYAKGVLP